MSRVSHKSGQSKTRKVRAMRYGLRDLVPGWLTPGIKIKRWTLLAALGLGLIGGGLQIALGLNLLDLYNWLVTLLVVVTGWDPFVAENLVRVCGGLVGAFGALLIVVSLRGIVKSLTQTMGSLVTDRPVSVLESIQRKRALAAGPKIVAVGGGTGLSALLKGLKEYTSNITALVTVSDEGGSSGVLRKEMGLIPPGDIRNCVAALAESESLVADLMQFRFTGKGGLEGHSLGNLLLAALTELRGGDFLAAIREVGRVLAIRGEVLPVTLDNVRLRARMSDGSVIEGETAIVKAPQSVERIELVPEFARPLPEALEAIARADAIVIGPGSVYTSIIPNLLVPGIASAVASAPGVKLFVVNVMTQPGETDGFSASDHAKVVLEHAGQRVFDWVIVNAETPRKDLLARYSQAGAYLVQNDSEALEALGLEVLEGDFVSETDLVRHNSNRLAETIIRIAMMRGVNREFLGN